MTPPLPPISTLAKSIYPPSAYPPPSFFEPSSLIYPALLIPARRTGEIQKMLQELVYKEPKRKSVFALEEGIDFSPEDVADSGYDPKKERKLVLNRLGPIDKSGNDGTIGENKSEESSILAMENDKVFQDPRIQFLLSSAKKKYVNDGSGGSKDAIGTAPPGKCDVRPSYISLPSSAYSLMTVDEVLRHLLPTTSDEKNENNDNPPIEEIPSSFEIAGHIAHLNLREEALPYKYLIGKAILDKNQPKIKVVVNKIGNIENEFRTFPMEILAGEGLDLDEVECLCAGSGEETGDNDAMNGGDGGDMSVAPSVQIKVGPQHQSLMEVQLKEHGCRFQLDFEKVYWNSRLAGEHERLVQYIVESCLDREQNQTSSGPETKQQQNCIIADVMAGVGPFAVPLTSANSRHYDRTNMICHANDLNPVSYKYLQTNARLNKCYADRLHMYNMDGREFIHKMNGDEVDVDHFIMNLPQMAPEFLDAFRGWKFVRSEGSSSCHRPLVHVHCFGEKARGPEDVPRIETQVLQRCEMALGCDGCLSVDAKKEENGVQVRVVRDVGPRKHMFCVSFRLPIEVETVDKLVIKHDNKERGEASCNKEEDQINSNGKRDAIGIASLDQTQQKREKKSL